MQSLPIETEIRKDLPFFWHMKDGDSASKKKFFRSSAFPDPYSRWTLPTKTLEYGTAPNKKSIVSVKAGSVDKAPKMIEYI